MYIAWPNEYDGDRAANSIELSTGEKYMPEKGKPPVMPCPACKDNHLRAMGACHSGLGICPAYMDYEYMKAAYRLAVFD